MISSQGQGRNSPAQPKPIQVLINSIKAPWFIDPNFGRIFSGHAYNMRCVAAIGPHDHSSILLVVTSNPRQALRKAELAAGRSFVVHAASWSIGRTADAVMVEIDALLDKAGVKRNNGWAAIGSAYLPELLRLGAEKAGVTAMTHRAFVDSALMVETEKLHARLTKSGVDPAVASLYCYTVVPRDPGEAKPPSTAPKRAKRANQSKFHRNSKIAVMFQDGMTHKEIGEHFGISSERVLSILHARGLTRKDGGAAVRKQRERGN